MREQPVGWEQQRHAREWEAIAPRVVAALHHGEGLVMLKVLMVWYPHHRRNLIDLALDTWHEHCADLWFEGLTAD